MKYNASLVLIYTYLSFVYSKKNIILHKIPKIVHNNIVHIQIYSTHNLIF